MTTTAIERPLRFAGVPAGSWAFGIRIWLAVVVALAASFWLELEAPSAAAVTVAILAEPTRGRALGEALFRLIAPVIGVTGLLRRIERRNTRHGSDTNLYSFDGLIAAARPFADEKLAERARRAQEEKERLARKKPKLTLVKTDHGS